MSKKYIVLICLILLCLVTFAACYESTSMLEQSKIVEYQETDYNGLTKEEYEDLREQKVRFEAMTDKEKKIAREGGAISCGNFIHLWWEESIEIRFIRYVGDEIFAEWYKKRLNSGDCTDIYSFADEFGIDFEILKSIIRDNNIEEIYPLDRLETRYNYFLSSKTTPPLSSSTSSPEASLSSSSKSEVSQQQSSVSSEASLSSSSQGEVSQQQSSASTREESTISSKATAIEGFVKDEEYNLYSKIVSCSIENGIMTVVFSAYTENPVNVEVLMDAWLSDDNGAGQVIETYYIDKLKEYSVSMPSSWFNENDARGRLYMVNADTANLAILYESR